jgi:hypothetical protein
MPHAASPQGSGLDIERSIDASPDMASPLMRELLQRALVRPADVGSLEDCKKLSVLMPRDLHRELKTFAFRHQTTITDLILAMVVELLAIEEDRSDQIAS